MSIGEIFGIVVVWNLEGFFLVALIMSMVSVFSENIRGLEYNNPFVIYRLLKVNMFGAVMIALAFSILCPMFSVCYWFYKLCTVGRKCDE